MKSPVSVLIAATAMLFAEAGASDDRAIGKEAFERACSACHSETPVPRAMSPAQMAKLLPEKIFKAQTEGLMLIQAAALNQLEQRAVAQFISETPWGSVPDELAEETLVTCESSSPLPADALERPRWVGWGVDLDQSHHQPPAQAGLSGADLGNLELKWAFGYPGGTTVGSQPTVVGGRLYLGSNEGGVYSLDAKTGCAHWKIATEGGVRAGLPIGKRAEGGFALFVADRAGWVHAFDADSGESLWKDRADPHEATVLTATPVLHEGRLYVASASLEELSGGSPSYECCTFRGSVVAYDAESGRRLWQSYVIPKEPAKTKKTKRGTQMWAPNGAGVWSSPTIDPVRGVLYITTGDSYAPPAADTSDSVMALDLETGAIRWSMQATPDDAFSAACLAGGTDPEQTEHCGPDIDFGASAVLRELPSGKRVLLAGQKSGVLHALDPDQNGKVLWRLSPGGVLGGIEWGLAADREVAYVPISDVWETRLTPGHAGGVFAVRIEDGKELWHTAAETPDCEDTPGCNGGQPQAATLIDGALFSGSMDGHMRAYDPKTGKVIWDVDTKREYKTVNNVAARGNSINGPGVTVVDGWVYFGSGYGLFGMPGNVFLAFGPK
jgi:polyvinyl alcohol dehydrogenase (cytochrome)